MMGGGVPGAHPVPDSVCLQGLVHTGHITVHPKASDADSALPNHMCNQAAPKDLLPCHITSSERRGFSF